MSHLFYLPDADTERATWLNNFAAKLSTYATTLNVAAATVTQTGTDSKNFSASVNYAEAIKQYGKQFTAFKNQLRDDAASTPSAPINITPAAPPVLPTFTTPVTIDVFGRIRLLVKAIKGNVAYTEAIGHDLGIIGADSGANASALLDDLQPDLHVTMHGSHPRLRWTKQGSDGLKIMALHGSGSFTLLTISTSFQYVDLTALPAAGATALWQYKAIYMLHDQEIGEWSNVVQISVAG